MFCNNCGSAIAADQAICGHCGKSVTGARVASAARMRVAEHVHLLAILWFVDGALLLIPAIVMAVLAGIRNIASSLGMEPNRRTSGLRLCRGSSAFCA